MSELGEAAKEMLIKTQSEIIDLLRERLALYTDDSEDEYPRVVIGDDEHPTGDLMPMYSPLSSVSADGWSVPCETLAEAESLAAAYCGGEPWRASDDGSWLVRLGGASKGQGRYWTQLYLLMTGWAER